MGALLSQAVANQLRQFPQSQDPRPSPPTLIQQVLNPPGPQESMRFAGLGEQNQLLQLSMDPNLTPAWKEAVSNALNRDMLKTALAFGGADITKEQRLKWEAENEAYRADRALSGTDPKMGSYPPGTRVVVRPYVYREDIKAPTRGGLGSRGQGVTGKELPMDEPHMTGVVVTPGAPDAGQPAETGGYWTKREKATLVDPSETPESHIPPSGDHVAVRNEGSNYWHWRHRDSLEVLPPLEKFPPGTKVQWEYRGKTWTGTVGEIPRSGHDKEYWHDQKKHIWIDTDVGPDEKPLGGWLPPEWLTKRKK